MRLTVALTAAVGAHALLFAYDLEQDLNISVSSGGAILHVEMIQEASFRDSLPMRLPAHKAQVKQQDIVSTVRTAGIKLFQEIQVNSVITQSEDESMFKESAIQVDDSTRVTAVIPDYLQALLLKNLIYPKQARRRGWQGGAEFQLDIYRQRVQQLTMLESTGYAILDRAAERGISLAESIPLADGRYRLPVLFRLGSASARTTIAQARK